MTDARSVFRPDLFAGTTSIVTGGGSGIGFAIARELATLGSRVLIAGRKADKLAHAAEQIRTQTGAEVHDVVCNIRDEEQVKALMARAVELGGRIDYLVNNAGGQFPSPAAWIRTKGWNAVIETNLTGTFLCCREAFLASMDEHGGSVVNIIADMWRGFPGMAHTGAARAAVDNLTKSLSLEWAWRGVRVNAVAPGIILSSGYDNYDPVFQKAFLDMADNIPARRLGTEEEVASSVMWLLSPGAQYVTGATLRVDGGSSLWRTHWEIPEHDAMPAYGGRSVEEIIASGKGGSDS
jgi:NAD(P)-dependent dehydrogenase (short-subunit alcohol dehydrogenase family)